MLGPWIAVLLFGGGVCLAVGLVYLGVALRWTRARIYLWLGLLGVLAAAKAATEARMYLASSSDAYGTAMKWQLGVTFLWGAILVVFVAEYVGGLRRSGRGVAAVCLGVVAVNGLTPTGIVFARVDELRQVALPWGERIAMGQGPLSPLWFLLNGAELLISAFLLAACVRAARHKPPRQALLLSLVLVTLVAVGPVYAFLVDKGVVELPYLLTAAIFLIVLAMSADLATQVARTFSLSRTIVANERRWRSLVDHARLLIVGLDRRGRIELTNPYVEEATGYRAEEVQGKSFLELMPAAQRDELDRRFSEALTGQPKPTVETAVRTREGSERIVVWRSVRLHDEEGAPSGLLSVGADVTERRRAESARDRALAELEELRRQLEEENLYLREELESEHDFDEIVGESDPLRYVLHKIQQVAPTETTVVILGETGVGKELVARAIHERGARRDRPFVRVNCAAFAAGLVESELFGHEAGAYTGARGARQGRFEVANGGTLFLDEIGELPFELQPKLLRVLQSGELERVGSSRTRRVDARVLAATNRDLETEVAAGRFRADLYYRLAVYPLTVPPLRERREDVPLLVHHYVPRIAARHGKSFEEVPGPVMRELAEYDWPGNVRELLNVLERAVITSPSPVLRLPGPLRSAAVESHPANANDHLPLAEVERRHIGAVLESTGWRISGPKGAAAVLELNPSTLRGRMRKLGIERP